MNNLYCDYCISCTNVGLFFGTRNTVGWNDFKVVFTAWQNMRLISAVFMITFWTQSSLDFNILKVHVNMRKCRSLKLHFFCDWFLHLDWWMSFRDVKIEHIPPNHFLDFISSSLALGVMKDFPCSELINDSLQGWQFYVLFELNNFLETGCRVRNEL